MEQFWLLLLALGIPSSVVGLGIWRIQVIINRAEKRRELAESCREKHQIILLKSINATMALGEATACAIKNGKCNGEVTDALEYAKQVKHEQRDFIQEMGIKNVI